jgi:hypothetical protein
MHDVSHSVQRSVPDWSRNPLFNDAGDIVRHIQGLMCTQWGGVHMCFCASAICWCCAVTAREQTTTSKCSNMLHSLDHSYGPSQSCQSVSLANTWHTKATSLITAQSHGQLDLEATIPQRHISYTLSTQASTIPAAAPQALMLYHQVFLNPSLRSLAASAPCRGTRPFRPSRRSLLFL